MKGEVFDVLRERGEDIPVVYMDSSVPAMSGSDSEGVSEVDKHIAKVKKTWSKDYISSDEDDERRRARQAEAERIEQENYRKREAGQASSVIPAAIKPPNFNQGAVSGTDSESENEFSKKLRGNRI